MPGSLLQRIPPKAIQLGFWGVFGVVAVMAFLGSSMTGYRYSPDLSAVTYSSLLQGFAVLAVATALGLALRKHILDVEIRTVEDRTLDALSRDLGWHGLEWSEDLEQRIRTLPPTMSVAAPVAAQPPALAQVPAPPPFEPAPPPAPPAAEDGEALDQELDSLLDAIMDEDQQPQGAASKAAQTEVEELEQMQLVTHAPPPAPPAEVAGPPLQAPTAQVEAATFIAAVEEHRGLRARRSELYTLMSGPLAQMGVLVGVSYYALPIATGSLAQDAFLNTALLFMSTYGAVVALAHTALSALRVVAS